MTENQATPGIYVTELSAFPPSVVGVATAVPVFIGYTETAQSAGVMLSFKPVLIHSLADYQAAFGGAATSGAFQLYSSLKLFFLNGGGDCYIVSTGGYDKTIDAAALMRGLDAAGQQRGPTITVVPDAIALPADPPETKGDFPKSLAFQTLVRAMLAQCGALQDRVAILDLYGAGGIDQHSPTRAADIKACVENFQADAGVENLSYGMTYFPPLVTAVDDAGNTTAMQAPSGALAGIFARNDAARGVWEAPANLSVNGVLKPSLALSEDEMEQLVMPLSGKSVNPIRDIPKQGILVWGARTLDGNSNDYRYVQVRRTIIYIEQSLKQALNQFVFAPNNGQTWVTVTTMISNFLNTLWSQGGLMGDKASDAYSVQCGLGSTMTGQDILNGYMIVSVTLQMIRPAEFIELTFTQKMQGVA